jgi:hypothetical protein
MSAAAHDMKQAAHLVIDGLPEGANLKDIIYELSVMQDIEDGLADSDAGGITDNATVRKQFGLSE